MRESLVGIALLLCTGCVQIPQWDTIERATSETELENATTQLEMNSGDGRYRNPRRKTYACCFGI